MKLKIILAGLLCTIIAPPALAVTKCVALNSNTTCASSSSLYQYHIDWAATCKTNGVSTPISSIGICSSKKGTSKYATAITLDTSSVDKHLNCWCRMISPAVSEWVFYASYESADSCARLCARHCAYDANQDTAAFLSALFGSLSD